MATAYAWQSSIPQFVSISGVLVAKHNRALWPTDDETWHYEAGPQVGKCEEGSWIRGVFCQGAQPSGSFTSALKTALRKEPVDSVDYVLTGWQDLERV